MLYKISSNKSLLFLAVVLFVYIFAQRQYSPKYHVNHNKPKITKVTDTIWRTKIDTFFLQTERYKTVYVPKIIVKNDPKISVANRNEVFTEEKHLFEKAREYQDTLQNEDIEIYSYSLLKGELLNSSISYKLKVPREIKTTTTIEHPSVYKSGLYGFGEVGGNQEEFSNISLGLQYNRKGRWFVSYRLNFGELSSVTHNVGIGIRLQ